MHIYMRVKLAVQLERLEMLWQKLHDMGISGEDDGEEGGSGGPPSFPYISAISASRPSSSAVDSPADSSRHACLLLLHLMNVHIFELHKPCPCISSHSEGPFSGERQSCRGRHDSPGRTEAEGRHQHLAGFKCILCAVWVQADVAAGAQESAGQAKAA